MILMIYINDRIHGNIEINTIAQSIIDTPEFQRLRRISQTGVLQWIFPSANYSRFEHNINIKNILYKIDSRNFPKITNETSAKYKIPIKNGMTSNDFHPLLKIKYFNKDNKIFNLKLHDYGILATNSFSEDITLFYEQFFVI